MKEQGLLSISSAAKAKGEGGCDTFRNLNSFFSSQFYIIPLNSYRHAKFQLIKTIKDWQIEPII